MNFLSATIETGAVTLRDGIKLTLPFGARRRTAKPLFWGSGPSTLPKPARALR